MESVDDRLLKYAHIENIPSDTPTVGFPLQHYNANPALRDFNMFLRFDIPGMTIDSQDLGYYVKTAKCVLLKCLLDQVAVINQYNHGLTINFDHITYTFFYYLRCMDEDLKPVFGPGVNMPICSLMDQIRQLATQLKLIEPIPGSSIPILSDLGLQALMIELEEPFNYEGHLHFDPNVLTDFLNMSLSFEADEMILFTAINEPGYIIEGMPLHKAMKHRIPISLNLYLEHKVSFAKAAELAGLNMEEFIKVIQTGNKL